MKTLLLVESDPEIQDVVRQALPPDEWMIEHADSNSEVLVLVRSKAYDVIITGAKTSAREDVELLREVRAASPRTKVIILTEQSTPAEVLEAMTEHAFSYFSKPFSIDALATIVEVAVAEPSWDDGIELLSAKPEWIGMRVRCEIATAERLLQFVKEIKIDLPPDERNAVAAAFRELLMNAIEHGGGLDPDRYVEISYVRGKHAVICHIKDPGVGFSAEDLPHAAVGNPAEDPLHHVRYRESVGLRPGGFGLLLARNLVDELTYSQKGNEVILLKYLKNLEPKVAT